MKSKIGSSFFCLPASLSSPFQHRWRARLSFSQGLFDSDIYGSHQQLYPKAKSCQFKQGMLKFKGSFQRRSNVPYVVSEVQSQYSELENDTNSEDFSPATISSLQLSGSGGKPGFLSFHNRPFGTVSEIPSSNSERKENNILWFVCPAVLVASFIFPSLYLRKILSAIFEDSLLTGK